MSKKIISLLLAVMLTVSMITVAAISVSASTDEQGRYVPSIDEHNRYYFYMPSDWYNDKADHAGIYWWEGTDACSSIDGGNPDSPAWPGHTAQPSDVANIYYVDCPADVGTIIWNNGFDGGDDATNPDYVKAVQTVNIGCEYYDPGESPNYPDGTDSFDNMIYVVNPNYTSVSVTGKSTFGGEWYYYYGNGEYGFAEEKGAGGAAVYTTDYQPPKDVEESTAPTTDTTTPETTTATEGTDATTVPATEGTTAAPQVPYLTVNATSNYFPEATAVYDETTNEVTVTYNFQSSKNMLNTQWELTYDPDVLSLSSKNNIMTVMPQVKTSGGVLNMDNKGRVIGNATNLGLYDFSTKAPFVQMTFDVNDLSAVSPVNTTVDLTVDVLTVSKVGSDFLTDTDEEVVLVDDAKVIDTPATQAVTVSLETLLTESTFVPATVPTTIAPDTTVAPTTVVVPTTTVVVPTTPETTVAPDTTVAPETTEEATTIVAPTAGTDATSATGATVNGGSTSDTANNTNNNGAVQTGDASLAVIILTLLVAATGVMFVLRKREML